MFTVNIHPVERVIRGAVGLFILSLVVWGPTSNWGLLGIIPLATALTGWCPPYHLLGFSTLPKKTGA